MPPDEPLQIVFPLPKSPNAFDPADYLSALQKAVCSGLGVPAEALGIEKAGFQHGYYKTVHTNQGSKQVYVQPGQVLHAVQQHLLAHGKSTAQQVANATEIPTHHVLQALGHLTAEGEAELHEDGAFPAHSDQGKSYSHKGEYDHPEGYIEHSDGHLLPTVAAGKLKPGTHLASGSEVTSADGSGKFTLESGTTFPFVASAQVPVKPEHFTHGTSPVALATAKKAHAAAKKTKSVIGIPQGGGLSDTASPEVLHSHAKLLANAGVASHEEVAHAFGHLDGKPKDEAESEDFSSDKPAPKTEAEQKQAVLTVIQAAGKTGIKESEVALKAHVNAFTTAKIISGLFHENKAVFFHQGGQNWVKIASPEVTVVPAPAPSVPPAALSEDALEILRQLQHPELEEYGKQAAGAYLFANHSTHDPQVFEAAVEELKSSGAISVTEKPSGDLLKLNPDWEDFQPPPAVVLEPEEDESDDLEVQNPKTPDGKIWVDVGDVEEVFAWYAPSGAKYYLRESSYGDGMSLTMMPKGSSQYSEFLGVFGDAQAAADYAAALEVGHAQMAATFAVPSEDLAKEKEEPEKSPETPPAAESPVTPSAALLDLLTASPGGLSASELGSKVFPEDKPATSWTKANKLLLAMEASGKAYKVGSKWKLGSAPGAPEAAPPETNYQKIAQFITAHPGSTAAEITAGTGLSEHALYAEGVELQKEFASHAEPGKPPVYYPKDQKPEATGGPQLQWTSFPGHTEAIYGNKTAQAYKSGGGYAAAWKMQAGGGWNYYGGGYGAASFPTEEEAQLWAEAAMGVSPASTAPDKQLLTAIEALGQLGGKATGMQVASKMGANLQEASEQLEAAYQANEVHHEGSKWALGPHTIPSPQPLSPPVVATAPPAVDYGKFKYPGAAAAIYGALQGYGTLTIGQAGKLAFPTESKGSQYSKPQDILNKLVQMGLATGGEKGPYSAIAPAVPEPEPEPAPPAPAPVTPVADFSQIKYPQEAVEKIWAAIQQGPLKINQAQAIGFANTQSSYWTAAKNVLLALKKQGLVVSDDETKKLSQQVFSFVPPSPAGEVASPFTSGGKITQAQLQQALIPGVHYSSVALLNALGLPHDVTSLSVLKGIKDQGLLEQVGTSYVLPGTAFASLTATAAPFEPVTNLPDTEKVVLSVVLQNPGITYEKIKKKGNLGIIAGGVVQQLKEQGILQQVGDGITLTGKGKLHAVKAEGGTFTAVPSVPGAVASTPAKKTALEALALLGGKGTTGAVAGKMPASFALAGKDLQAAELSDQVHKEGTLWVLGPKPEPAKPKVYAGESFDPYKEKSTLYHAVFDTLKAAEDAGEGPQFSLALASQIQMVNKYDYGMGEYQKQTQVVQALKHLQKMGLVQVDSSAYQPKYSLVPGKSYPWPKAKTPKAGTAQATGSAQADQVAAGVSPAGPAPTAIPEVTDVPGVTVEHLQDILSVAGKSPLALIQMTYVAPKPGGTVTGKGSGVYTAPDGEKYVVKHAFGGDPHTGAVSAPPYKYWDKDPGDEHSRSEVLATKLAMACGVPVPDCKRVELGGAGFPGKWGIASEWIDVTPGEWNSPGWVEAAQDQFAIHAWLGNWDVVGAAKDNMVTGPDGQPLCIDWGGSLLFRAQGKKKWLDGEETFGPSVSEWDTFTSGSFDAVKLFGSMTAAQKIESAKRVAVISEPAIRALVDEFGPSNPSEREKLYSILCSRRKDIIKRANSEAKNAEFALLEAEKEKQDQASVQHLVSSSWKGVEASVAGASQAFKTVGKGGLKVLQGAGETGNYFKQWGYYVHLNDPAANGELAESKQKAHQIVQEALGLDAATFNPNQSPFYSPTGSKTHGSGHGGYQVPPPSGSNITLYDTDKTAAKVKKVIESKLPTAAQNALKSYLGGGYTGQNKGLRTGTPASNATLARNAFHEVAHELPAGSYSERGLSLSQSVLENLRKAPGVVLQEPGFSSASPTQPWGGNVTLCIYAAPGAKALNVKKFQSSALEHEDELLFGPDQRYLVFAVGDGKDVKGQQKTLVHVLALPPEEA